MLESNFNHKFILPVNPDSNDNKTQNSQKKTNLGLSEVFLVGNTEVVECQLTL